VIVWRCDVWWGITRLRALRERLRYRLPTNRTAVDWYIRRHPATSGLTTITILLHPSSFQPSFQSPVHDVGIFEFAESKFDVVVAKFWVHRARKGNIKGVEATGGKSRGTKRTATDEILASLRKRQKAQSSPGLEIQDQPKQDQITLRVQDQVFRFMDLPAGTWLLLISNVPYLMYYRTPKSSVRVRSRVHSSLLSANLPKGKAQA
jgi:hypothetical protein